MTIWALLALLLVILGYCVFVTRLSGWPAATTPFFTVSSIVALLYLFGLAGVLRPGAQAILITSLAVLLWCCLGSRRNLGESLRVVSSPGIVCFVLGSLGIWLKVRGAAYSSWDEFATWGILSKEIIRTHALTGPESPLALKDYPPGGALFHYLVVLIGGYSEGITYVAQDLLLLAPLVALLQGLTWRRWPLIIATMLFSYLAIFIFGLGLLSVHTDDALGIFFGAGLASYWVSVDRGTGALLRVVPVVFCLPLLKQIGLLFAVLVVVAICLDQIIQTLHRRVAGEPGDARLDGRRRAFVRVIPALVLVAVSPLVASYTWNHRVKALGLRTTFGTDFSLAELRRSFSASDSTERDRVTIRNFRGALASERLGARTRSTATLLDRLLIRWTEGASGGVRDGYRLTARGAIMALIAASVAGLFLQESSRTRWQYATWCVWMMASCAIYLGVLLALYLYSFGEYEGSRVVGFPRYVGTFLLGWSLVVFAIALEAVRRAGGRRMFPAVLLGAIVAGAILVAPGHSVALVRESAPGMSRQRVALRQLAKPVELQVGLDKKVYIIWQRTSGFEHRALAYEIVPRPSNEGCWSVGEPYYAGDAWTCRMTALELARTLRAYDFLLLGRVDDAFRQRFGSLFPQGARVDAGALFEVDKSPSESVLLRPR